MEAIYHKFPNRAFSYISTPVLTSSIDVVFVLSITIFGMPQTTFFYVLFCSIFVLDCTRFVAKIISIHITSRALSELPVFYYDLVQLYFPVSLRITSSILGHPYGCPSANEESPQIMYTLVTQIPFKMMTELPKQDTADVLVLWDILYVWLRLSHT